SRLAPDTARCLVEYPTGIAVLQYGRLGSASHARGTHGGELSTGLNAPARPGTAACSGAVGCAHPPVGTSRVARHCFSTLLCRRGFYLPMQWADVNGGKP